MHAMHKHILMRIHTPHTQASMIEAQERLRAVHADPERLEELRESFDMLDMDHSEPPLYMRLL